MGERRMRRWISAAVAAVLGVVMAGGLTISPAGAETTSEEQAFVMAVFTDVLEREPTDQELESYSANLADGDLSRREMVRRIALGPDNLAQEVTRSYQQALLREPDEQGFNHWTNTLGYTSYGFSRFEVDLWASQEFLRRNAFSPDPVVRAWYAQMIGRPADDAGLAHWSSVGSERGPRAAARGLYESLENRHARVTEAFQAMLGRTPDSEALAFWSERIITLGDLWLLVWLGGSDEYRDRANARFL